MAEQTGPMDGLNTQMLQALLDILVESGVEEFEGAGIHVRFTPSLFSPENRVESGGEVRSAERSEPRNLWEAPELWPGGKPPGFPGNPIK